MKKLVLRSTLILGIIFFSGTIIAQTTQSPDKTAKAQTTQTSQNTYGNFIDKNGDGICDNYPNRGQNNQGRNFVDKNNDGVCDNFQSDRPHRKGYGQGNQVQSRFQRSCQGYGSGHQHRHGWINNQQATPSQPEKK